MIAILLMLGLPFLAGAALARAFGLSPRGGALAAGAWAGWSWVLGALATALVTFAWMWTPLAKDSWVVPGAALLAVAIGAWARGRRAPRLHWNPKPLRTAPRVERSIFGVIVAALALLTIQRIAAGDAIPIYQDDEAHFWALKAKLIFQAGGLNDAFQASLEDPHYLYHRDYPLLNPLLQLWAFACAGEVTHVANRLPLQMFSLALVPLLASALARSVRPGIAAMLLCVVFTCENTRMQARTAHSDLMVALGVMLALDAWLRWRAMGTPAWARLACVGLGLAVFAKGEGLLFLIAVVAAFPTARLLGRRPAVVPGGAAAPRAWCLLPLGVVALTWAVNAHFGFTNDIATTEGREESFLELLFGHASERVPFFLTWCLRTLLPHREWAGHLPFVFLMLCLGFAPRLRRLDLAVPALAIAAAALGFTLILLGTPHDPEWHLPTAFPRITWQLVPAMALWIGAVLGRFPPPLDKASFVRAAGR